MAHAITASVIEKNVAERDGRAYITERHTWDDARISRVTYLAAAGANYAAKMTARAVDLVAERTSDEAAAAQQVIGDSIRAKLAAFLLSVTDANLKSQLNLTTAEVTAFRASDIITLAGRVTFL